MSVTSRRQAKYGQTCLGEVPGRPAKFEARSIPWRLRVGCCPTFLRPAEGESWAIKLGKVKNVNSHIDGDEIAFPVNEAQASMVDLEDGADVRMLMKKLWCHGQAIAPLQGFAYAVWALSDDGALSFSFRVLLWVAALKFPVWGYVSWQCLQLIFGPRSFLILAMLGAIVIAMDMLIAGFAIANDELSRGWPLVAFIFTCLHAVETTAFLSVVACFKWALMDRSKSPSLLPQARRTMREEVFW